MRAWNSDNKISISAAFWLIKDYFFLEKIAILHFCSEIFRYARSILVGKMLPLCRKKWTFDNRRHFSSDIWVGVTMADFSCILRYFELSYFAVLRTQIWWIIDKFTRRRTWLKCPKIDHYFFLQKTRNTRIYNRVPKSANSHHSLVWVSVRENSRFYMILSNLHSNMQDYEMHRSFQKT